MRPRPVTVIGCDGSPPGPRAAAALAAAHTVIGAPRHLAAAAIPPGADRIELGRLQTALDAAAGAGGPVVILASGDPGFFGIVRALRAAGITPQVIPAVSSVALAFAGLALDWDDALVLSAHGRDPRPALAAALAHPKAAILTAPDQAARLGAELLHAGRKVYVAERLGAPDERITDLATEPPGEFRDPNVLIALDPDAPGAPRWLAGHTGAPPGWALPEEAFEHRDSMITKAEVRALALARLAPAPGRTIWDVGAGSGSVAVECARFGARVLAVEADPAQCARIRANAGRHGVYLQVVQGRAPQALAGLPPADAVFVGGGDAGVLAAAIRHASPARVVVTLAVVQRVGETTQILAGLGYPPEGVQLQSSRLTPLPNASLRLAAENPVFVVWAHRSGNVDRCTPHRGSSDPRSSGAGP
jgi:precorrin-6Y C5,15-methyltransferase (decarboxylating)